MLEKQRGFGFALAGDVIGLLEDGLGEDVAIVKPGQNPTVLDLGVDRLSRSGWLG